VPDDPTPIVDVVLRFSVAVGCAAILGWERESHDKPAGLRTHMMVALGSAAFTMAALILTGSMADNANVRSDPLRLVDGIIGGIGFLGAGTIIQSRGSVHGVTTAAGIWVMGAIGVASGCGYFMLAGITTGYAFVILGVLGRLQRRSSRHKNDGPNHSIAEPNDEQ
jgi:putative Mg2+ transporter-C (MgtC) family protein